MTAHAPANHAEIVGKVTYLNRTRLPGNRKLFTLCTNISKKSYACRCDFFCPLDEGDAVSGIVDTSNPKEFVFVTPPFVQIATDKDSLLRCFIKVLRGTGFGDTKAKQLYEAIAANIRVRRGNSSSDTNSIDTSIVDSSDVAAYLAEMAALYKDTADDSMLSIYASVVKDKQMSTLLSWWQRHRSMRRLYLLGLNNKEIRDCRMSLDQLYARCIKNPLTVVTLSVEKCHSISARLNRTASNDDNFCGQVSRKIYEYQENKGWVGIPAKIMLSLFPAIPQHQAKLQDEYGIKFDMGTFYLAATHAIETGMAATLDKILACSSLHKVSEPRYLAETLTEDQKKAVDMAVNNNVSIVTGSAGTGKTTLIKEIVHNDELQEIPYMVASFTGKAVARIREVLGQRSPATLHRLIANHMRVPKFKHLILDEASMITTELLSDFFGKFPPVSTGRNDEVKLNYSITFIGDPNQLEPIGAGCLFEQIIACARIPHAHLSTIHRLTDKSGQSNGILINATNIIRYNIGDTADEDGEQVPFAFCETNNFVMTPGSIETVYDVLTKLHHNNVPADKVTIISPYNRDLDTLNKMAQQIYNDGNRSVVDAKGTCWMIRDRVVMKENDYDINVMNGEEGLVVDVSDTDILVSFRDGARHSFKLTIPRDDEKEDKDKTGQKMELHVGQLKHGFALSCHCSQGSEWEYVVFYVPENTNSSRFLNRKLVYTAITRARRAVWNIGHMPSLNVAAVRPSGYRCDNLAKRLTTFTVNTVGNTETSTTVSVQPDVVRSGDNSGSAWTSLVPTSTTTTTSAGNMTFAPIIIKITDDDDDCDYYYDDE